MELKVFGGNAGYRNLRCSEETARGLSFCLEKGSLGPSIPELITFKDMQFFDGEYPAGIENNMSRLVIQNYFWTCIVYPPGPRRT